MDTKMCSKCLKRKPLSEFRVYNNCRRNECIECGRVVARERKRAISKTWEGGSDWVPTQRSKKYWVEPGKGKIRKKQVQPRKGDIREEDRPVKTDRNIPDRVKVHIEALQRIRNEKAPI